MPRGAVRAESVASADFAIHLDLLSPDDRARVLAAVVEIERNPAWKPPHRWLAPPISEFSGCIADRSVPGFTIVYRVVDQGLAVELWELFTPNELPIGFA